MPKCVCVSCSVVFNSLRPHGLQSARLLHPWDSPGKNTGVNCHSILQGIFLTQWSNPGLPHCRQTLYCLSHKTYSQRENFGSSKRKAICHIQGNLHKIISSFLSRNITERTEMYIQSAERKKKAVNQEYYIYLAKLSFKSKWEIKSFLEQKKLREFIPPWSALAQQQVKNILFSKMSQGLE